MGTERAAPRVLSFDEARARLLAGRSAASRPSASPLGEAGGRVLAEDARRAASRCRRFDNSAMDGYAVATADLQGGGPVDARGRRREQRGHGARRGSRAARRAASSRARPVPARADAVVMQEHVDARGRRDPARRAAARRAAHPARGGGPRARRRRDRRGDAAVRRARWRSRRCSSAPSSPSRAGRASPSCARATSCARRATRRARRPSPSRTARRSSALARQAGADVRVAPIARDEPARHAARRRAGARRNATCSLTVGGVSVGDHDVVRPALERAGVDARLLAGRHQAGQAARVRAQRGARTSSACRATRRAPS